jgi:hypothetical protein
MDLSISQARILARVQRYPQGVLLSPADHRTAKVLQRKGLIEYDEKTGIARGKE